MDVSSKKSYLHKEENEGYLPSKHLFVYYLIIRLGLPSILLKAKMKKLTYKKMYGLAIKSGLFTNTNTSIFIVLCWWDETFAPQDNTPQ